MTAPLPPRFCQGESVLAGIQARVSAVYPPDSRGRRRYGVAVWSPPARAFVDAGVVDERDISPAPGGPDLGRAS